VAMFRWNWRKQEQKAIKLKERKKRTDRWYKPEEKSWDWSK
jgi:hypothetical protein